jgi:aspartate aminotransferase
MATIQGQSTSNPSSIAQRAAVMALNGDQACVAAMNAAYRERHDFLVPALNALPGVRCRAGAGTFYAFADISEALQTLQIADDTTFAEQLLEQTGVAVVPGSGFGAPGHMRLSFATGLPQLQDAVERLQRFLRPA